MNILYAFYDLEVSPTTFDITTFLVLAEAERKRINYDAINLVIAPGSNKGFRPGNWGQSQEEMEWRRDNLLIPCCHLLPSCKGVMVCADRAEVQGIRESVDRVFPAGYMAGSPKNQFHISHVIRAIRRGDNLCVLEANQRALHYVRTAFPEKVVSITLRESELQPERNSNIAAWREFALSLEGYLPVFVRDTAQALQPLPELEGLTVFNEAAWNIDLRMALYEYSHLNMYVNNGVACLSTYGKNTKGMCFKMITPAYKVTSEAYLRSQGLLRGAQLTPNMCLVWEDDQYQVIKKHFQRKELSCN